MRHESTTASAADLADLPVQDEQGQSHRLGETWRDQTAVLAFVRHFG
jgi:hypothetical protein